MSLTLITGKSQFIPQSKGVRSLSKLYIKDGKLYGETKCRICGQWIVWCGGEVKTKTDLYLSLKFKQAKNCNDPSVVSRSRQGKSLCEDWTHIRTSHLAAKAMDDEADREKKAAKIFKKLLETRII